MGLPFVLDVAIGLIFIFLILSLLASEIQELVTTLLQWRAKHLKQSIEVLLAGGTDTPDAARIKELADGIYADPLLKNVNQEANDRISKRFRSLTHLIVGDSHRIFGGGRTTGPSYIPAETFATSLMERLGLPVLAQKLTEVRLRRFASRIVGLLSYDRTGRVRVLKTPFLKDNWQKGSIRVTAESLKRLDLVDGQPGEPDESNENFQLFRELVEEYDDVLRSFESSQSTLETSVERMSDGFRSYIDNLKLRYKAASAITQTQSLVSETTGIRDIISEESGQAITETAIEEVSGTAIEPDSGNGSNGKSASNEALPDEEALRLIRRLESLKLALFGVKSERAILSGGLRPSVYEIAQLINQSSNTYREVADAYRQVTIDARPIEARVYPEIQQQLLQDQLEVVEKQLQSSYFEILEKQLAEDTITMLKKALIQRSYLDQNVIEMALEPEQYRDLLDEELQEYVLENKLEIPDIGLGDIPDRAQVQQIITNVINELSQAQTQRVVSTALSQITDSQRQEILQPTVSQFSSDQRQLIACQPIANTLLPQFEVAQRLHLIRTTWNTLNPEHQQRLRETIWQNLGSDQRLELAETVLDGLTERQRQRIVRSTWAVTDVSTRWDRLTADQRQNLIDTAFLGLTADERQRLSQLEWSQLALNQQQTIAQTGQVVRQALDAALIGEPTPPTESAADPQKRQQRDRLISSIFNELNPRQRYNIALQLTIDGFRKLLTPEDQQLADWETLGARQLIINGVWGGPVTPPVNVPPEPIAPPISEPDAFETPISEPIASDVPASTELDPATLPIEALPTEALPTEALPPDVPETPVRSLPPEPLPLEPLELESRYLLLSREDQEQILNGFWEDLAADPTPSHVLNRLDKRIVSAALGRLPTEKATQIVGAAWLNLTLDLRQAIAVNAHPESTSEQTRLNRTDRWKDFSQGDRQRILSAVAVELTSAQRQQVVDAAWQRLNRPEQRQDLFKTAWQSLKVPQRQRLLSPVLQAFKDEQRRLILNLAWERLNPLQRQLIIDTYLRNLGTQQRQIVIKDSLRQLDNTDRRLLIDRALEQAQLTDDERRIYDNAQTYESIQEVLDQLPQSVRDSLESLARRSQSRAQRVGNEITLFRDEIGLWFDRSMSRASGVYKRNAKGVAIIIGITIAILTNSDALYMINRLSSDEELRKVITDEAVSIASSPEVSPTPIATATPTLAPTPGTSVRTRLNQIKRETDIALQDLALPIGWNLVNLKQQLRCRPSETALPNPDNIPAVEDWETFFNDCLAESSITRQAAPPPPIERFVTAIGRHWLAALLMPLGWAVSGMAIAMGAPFWFDILNKIINVRNSGGRPASHTPVANPGAAEMRSTDIRPGDQR